MHRLVHRYVDTAIVESRSQNDPAGSPAYAPQVWLKVVRCAYSRGSISSRNIAQACREHMTCMALACGMVPDHRTSAAVISSLQEVMVARVRAMLLVCAEQG